QDAQVAADARDPHDGAVRVVQEQELARGEGGGGELAPDDAELEVELAEAEGGDDRQAGQGGRGAAELDGGGVDAGMAEVEQRREAEVGREPGEVAEDVAGIGA